MNDDDLPAPILAAIDDAADIAVLTWNARTHDDVLALLSTIGTRPDAAGVLVLVVSMLAEALQAYEPNRPRLHHSPGEHFTSDGA
ncbi:hypothetical protein [Microbacterium sp. KR10-403]|uniref:hypothetical protein n=1 Tax=Microbacterium sp. KR10-403 TaxID=3158581 RepID=UPI0032E48AE8